MMTEKVDIMNRNGITYMYQLAGINNDANSIYRPNHWGRLVKNISVRSLLSGFFNQTFVLLTIIGYSFYIYLEQFSRPSYI